MRKTGLHTKGNWYKGNLHTHSTNSDGRKTPEEIVRIYREHGYQFLAFTEHEFYTHNRELTGEDFLILPASNSHATIRIRGVFTTCSESAATQPEMNYPQEMDSQTGSASLCGSGKISDQSSPRWTRSGMQAVSRSSITQSGPAWN